MAYSDFTLPEVTKRFQLVIRQQAGLFAYAPVVEPSALLAENLTENIPLAASIATEKARSELIIMPILVEVRRRLNHQVSLFSGVDFTGLARKAHELSPWDRRASRAFAAFACS